jgi:hypothetical protein
MPIFPIRPYLAFLFVYFPAGAVIHHILNLSLCPYNSMQKSFSFTDGDDDEIFMNDE